MEIEHLGVNFHFPSSNMVSANEHCTFALCAAICCIKIAPNHQKYINLSIVSSSICRALLGIAIVNHIVNLYIYIFYHRAKKPLSHQLTTTLAGSTTNCYGQTVTKTFCYDLVLLLRHFGPV